MADQNELTDWPVESISGDDHLYMGVHRTWFKRDGTIATGAFQNHNGGMSTDWSKYSTPEQTRERRRVPSRNAVVRLRVDSIRVIPGQSVRHTPLPENRAHTDVFGEKDEEVRVLLRRVAELVLPLPAQVV